MRGQSRAGKGENAQSLREERTPRGRNCVSMAILYPYRDEVMSTTCEAMRPCTVLPALRVSYDDAPCV